MSLLCLLWCYITASLFALSPARNGKQGRALDGLPARLAKSTAGFHAFVPHKKRIIQPMVTGCSQSSSQKMTIGCVDQMNVGHLGSSSAMWLSVTDEAGSRVTNTVVSWHATCKLQSNMLRLSQRYRLNVEAEFDGTWLARALYD
jgi:hypothetical protein